MSPRARAAATLIWVCGIFLSLAISSVHAAEATVLVVRGAAGEAEFDERFKKQVEQWRKAAERAGASCVTIGNEAEDAKTTDRERLQQMLKAQSHEGTAELWLVLLGHGTFDGKEAKFNLRGPDVTASELVEWLQPFRRPTAIINAASASAPFMAKLAAPNRVIVTSTRSGHEVNYARFGEHLSEAIAAPESDLDRDGQTSLLEAFLAASHRVAEFYKTEGRLATEHALIDDNGDGLGTPADWFRGVRATKRARNGASLDGTRAHQFHLVRSEEEQKLSPDVRARRDELEQQIAKLRIAKEKIPEEDYYQQLEALLLELAKLYRDATPEKRGGM